MSDVSRDGGRVPQCKSVRLVDGARCGRMPEHEGDHGNRDGAVWTDLEATPVVIPEIVVTPEEARAAWDELGAAMGELRDWWIENGSDLITTLADSIRDFTEKMQEAEAARAEAAVRERP